MMEVLLVLAFSLVVGVFLMRNRPHRQDRERYVSVYMLNAEKPCDSVFKPDPRLDPFDAAWMGLMAEIEGDAEPLLHFYKCHASSMQRDPYKTGIALSAEVPASAWQWPAYVAQVEVPLQEQSKEHKEFICIASLREVLELASLAELRAAVDGKVKARSKAALIEQVLIALSSEDMSRIVDQLRGVLLNKEDATYIEDYRDRCVRFVNRWLSLAYRARNVASFRESALVVPGMTAELLPSGGFREPCECERLEGGPFPVESPLLMQHAPCSRIDCGCCWVPVVPGWKSMVQR